MTDHEIWVELADMMQEHLRVDEAQLSHVKLLAELLNKQAGLMELLLSWTRLPAGPAKEIEGGLLAEKFQQFQPSQLISGNVAIHETFHERRAAFLDTLRKRLAAMEE